MTPVIIEPETLNPLAFLLLSLTAGVPAAKFIISDIVVFLILQEFYADFVAIDPYHFTLNIPSNYMYMLPAVVDPSTLQRFCDRVVDGLAAVFLALKRRPVIRYQRTSDVAKRIAQEAAVSRICAATINPSCVTHCIAFFS